jgi:Tfp pilus assembly protein PilF
MVSRSLINKMTRKNQKIKRNFGNKKPSAQTLSKPISPVIQTQPVISLFQQAVQYQNSAQIQQAIALYRQILQIEPAHYNSLTNLAIILCGLKNYEESIAYFQTALKLNRNQGYLIKNFGIEC